MRRFLAVLLCVSAFSATLASAAPKAQKEWTFLIFLNGKNSLDNFGPFNINQMEKVGSTDQVNVVVQWGSIRNGKTQRLYITKDGDTNTVTSPVVQDMGNVDMGDYRSLVEFVRWGHENYPAKKYFVDVWDHGAGWHLQNNRLSPAKKGGGLGINDISWDDETGNYITTEQLGHAMTEAANIIGHKIDLYGSDACLMAMAEVAGEMASSVSVFAGSEEVEPGEGWPYDALLAKWTAKPTQGPKEVATILTKEYVNYYQTSKHNEVQFSAFDLGQTATLESAMTKLSQAIIKSGSAEQAKLATAASATQKYTYSDYADLGDFLAQARASKVAGMPLDETAAAVKGYVVANGYTTSYKRSQGVAVWIPSRYTYSSYIDRYRGLNFHKNTSWGDALAHLY